MYNFGSSLKKTDSDTDIKIKLEFKKTQFYLYYLDNMTNETLHNIVDNYFLDLLYDSINTLSCCYSEMFDNYMFDDIISIINRSSELATEESIYDKDCIVYHSIINNKPEFINLYNDNGFYVDLNLKLISIDNIPLNIAISTEQIDMCKYIVSNKVNFDINQLSLINEFIINEKIFNYFMSFDLNPDDLTLLVENILKLSPTYFSKIQKIINMGFSMKKIDIINNDNICSKLIYYNIDQIQYFIDNGLNIHNSNILYHASINKNYILVDLLIKNNLFFDKYITKKIFEYRNISIIEKILEYDCDTTLVKSECRTDKAIEILEKFRHHGLEDNEIINFLISKIS